MTIPNKTLQNGFSMPVLGLGTWNMGGAMTRDTTNDTKDIEAIQHAIDMGITHIDTAEMYGAGHSEELIATAVQGIDRSKLFIVSKVSPEHLHYDDVMRSAEQSLKRLNMDYLDLYLVHKPNPQIPMESTMKAFNLLKDQGLVKHIGVSDLTKERFIEAQSYAKYPLVTDQLHYNLIFREPERKGLVSYCQENDIMLTAWRPVQKGMLSNAKNDIMQQMTKKYGKTPSQIAINWLVSQKNIVTISKMSSIEHIKENLEALTFTMEETDIELLKKQYPGQEDVSDAVPLV